MIDSIELDDGSIVALGYTRPCSFGDGRQVLVKLDADGTPIVSFGDRGFAVDERSGRFEKIVSWSKGRLLTFRHDRIRIYTASGVPDTEIIHDGELSPADLGLESNALITDVITDPDGRLYVAAMESGDVTVSRYDGNGVSDESFGSDGTADPGVRGPSYLALDPKGRLLVVASALTRLLDGGSVDVSFGEDGFVEPDPWDVFHHLSVDQDGRIKLITGRSMMYGKPAFLSIFESDGQEVRDGPNYTGGVVNAAVPVPGGAAAASGAGKMMDPEFEIGLPHLERPFRYLLSPGLAQAVGVTLLSDGAVLAVGYAHRSDRATGSVMALVKLDPASGRTVRKFGSDGVRLLPSNRCGNGSVGVFGDWRICRVTPPQLASRLELSGRYGGRPRLLVRTWLGPTPPSELWGSRQRVTLSLPQGVRLRRGAARRIELKTNPSVPTKLRIRGQRITWLATPPYDRWPGIFGYIEPTIDRATAFRLNFRRGALAPLPRKLRKRTLRFRLTGTLIPVKGGFSGDPNHLWFGSNSARITVAAPRPARKRGGR